MRLLLVVNSGSSSLKFRLFQVSGLKVVAEGLLERINLDGRYLIKQNQHVFKGKHAFPNHQKVVKFLIDQLQNRGIITNLKDLVAVGHRVVQGGQHFKSATLLEEQEIKIIKALSVLAPLHNPGAVAGIMAFRTLAPHAKNIADFDTAFHTTIPSYNSTYPVPKLWREKYLVKRYGMHGISYEYVTRKMSEILNKSVEKTNLIIAHLGNGASVAAVRNGQSYNTSMGLTPLAGLVMGTRCGDIDPAIPGFVGEQTQQSISAITKALNNESGLKALTGSSDMRDVVAKSKNQDGSACLGLKIWSRQIANYVVTYYNQLGGDVDAIVFTAGIGENSPEARQLVLQELKTLPVKINVVQNDVRCKNYMRISTSDSALPCYVVCTNEEKLIATKVCDVLKLKRGS